jgi:DNA-directed RNA polymerase specialized sigma24 family protein
MDKVRNEEIAAAGALPAQTMGEGPTPRKPKDWLKGTQGLGQKKADLSRYLHGLTDKQQLAASLKWEYGLGLSEIASRMGVDRKTAYEHIEAAKKRMDEVRSSEKRDPESS